MRTIAGPALLLFFVTSVVQGKGNLLQTLRHLPMTSVNYRFSFQLKRDLPLDRESRKTTFSGEDVELVKYTKYFQNGSEVSRNALHLGEKFCEIHELIDYDGRDYIFNYAKKHPEESFDLLSFSGRPYLIEKMADFESDYKEFRPYYKNIEILLIASPRQRGTVERIDDKLLIQLACYDQGSGVSSSDVEPITGGKISVEPILPNVGRSQAQLASKAKQDGYVFRHESRVPRLYEIGIGQKFQCTNSSLGRPAKGMPIEYEYDEYEMEITPFLSDQLYYRLRYPISMGSRPMKLDPVLGYVDDTRSGILKIMRLSKDNHLVFEDSMGPSLAKFGETRLTRPSVARGFLVDYYTDCTPVENRTQTDDSMVNQEEVGRLAAEFKSADRTSWVRGPHWGSPLELSCRYTKAEPHDLMALFGFIRDKSEFKIRIQGSGNEQYIDVSNPQGQWTHLSRQYLGESKAMNPIKPGQYNNTGLVGMELRSENGKASPQINESQLKRWGGDFGFFPGFMAASGDKIYFEVANSFTLNDEPHTPSISDPSLSLLGFVECTK